MSLIKPFKAFYYNPDKITSYCKVVTPPYDVINSKQKKQLKKTNKYNFCNVSLTDSSNDYKLLAKRFHKWIDDGVLIQDEKESFYLYEQKFKFEGKMHSRVGVFTLLKVDKQEYIVPHERTFSAHKQDRFSMMCEAKANMSPIFIMLSKKFKPLSDSYASLKNKKPFIQFTDVTGIKNTIWKIDDEKTINKMVKAFGERKVFIADGHHRTEVARRYFNKSKSKFKDLDHCLAYFTDPDNGLLILPTHRVVKLKYSLRETMIRLSQDFEITPVKSKMINKALKACKGISFGLYIDKKYYLLRLKDTSLKKFTRRSKKPINKLDVKILHEKIIPFVGAQKDITYTHSFEEAVNLTKPKKCAFILRATPLKAVFNIAQSGGRMPQKSTFFYPKLLSGIVIRRFEK